MKTYVVIYEGFAHFEVVLASYFLKTKGEIITVGINKDPVLSGEGYKIIPDIALDQVNVDELDVLIIPDGNPDEISHIEKLYEIIESVDKNNKVIGAICSGVYHLGKAGVLNDKKYTTTLNIKEYSDFEEINYKDKNYVIDNNVITAKANSYVDFGIELGKMMDIYENEDDLKETIDFFKLFKC